MIKTKKLMLGNWVLAGAKTQFPMYVTGIFDDVAYLDFEGNEGDVWEEKEEDMLPVPLTEEILLKNGFVLESDGYRKEYLYKDQKNNFINIEFEDGKCAYICISVKRREVTEQNCLKYLHEFQNMITLAGIEMEFKI
jgi:hypothetical protein